MKRILAFVMIFMLLCGSALATNAEFAAGTDTHKWVADGKTDDENTAQTELWLKVAATGQIDVTVPLVLVFSTNIEGGTATSASNYTITNHSTADLAVVSIAANVKNDTGSLEDSSNPMTLVAYNNTPGVDEYAIQLSAPRAQNNKGEYIPKNSEAYVVDINSIRTTSATAGANAGGLFLLKKNAENNSTGQPTTVTPTMKTGELTFVTHESKGVYLLTITYTVAIDTSAAIGETITNAKDGANGLYLQRSSGNTNP